MGMSAPNGIILNLQVLEYKISPISIVGQNSANFSGRYKNNIGFRLLIEGIDLIPIGKIKGRAIP